MKIKATRNKFVLSILFILTSFPGLAAATAKQTLFPAGSPMSEVIHFQYAIYYLPKPAQDPRLILKQQLKQKSVPFRLVKRVPKKTRSMLLDMWLENQVQRRYSPPDMESLKYFAHGMSREQAQALQKSQQALIINFVYQRQHLVDGLRAASQLIEAVARQTDGLVWDELTREIYTPDAWHELRLKDWQAGIPDVSRHITIHAYKSKELVRAITLGMAKFGLPDIVIDNFPWSSNRSIGHVINLFAQAMAEGATFSKPGEYDLDLKSIQHAQVRESQLKSLKENATAVARLTLRTGIWEEGDPNNRLLQITFDRYNGNDAQAKQEAMLSSLFGFEDSITYIKHNQALLDASARAKARLPALRDDFNKGLHPGEFIQLKAPFDTPDGGHEWMWVEVSQWHGDEIRGMLKNEPYNIPELHGGQMVTVRQQDIFDYIRNYPDGHQEGNETGKIILQMQK